MIEQGMILLHLTCVEIFGTFIRNNKRNIYKNCHLPIKEKSAYGKRGKTELLIFTVSY